MLLTVNQGTFLGSKKLVRKTNLVLSFMKLPVKSLKQSWYKWTHQNYLNSDCGKCGELNGYYREINRQGLI